ncbi:3-oxoacyl-[acyl-carrier-protein] synthase III C-terminal domain-containing protein [Pseudomonas sp. 6D_7.1_Bac1]|uniref:3-oxoacyl-[acyl-carrier-protein] synthase III C-terminal domain-containing protein n=1 Tax=Pseudomonas sp. 6D_7.1_Bac1 TaxID=2971615 RepID=UPI0021C90FEE|nr:3-oxoacyl-[acyl-carrier-protein] synthase III C-terminal domain-containing protein [Pseudomonas sp. 6D_7.1_Bac1]MCU1748579.1 3-oxoacyl-ACP synthase [Pseudomonas sp. 6D_7.1_Bac1]
MLGHIESITVYIPEQRKSLAEVAPSLGLTPLDVRMFSRFYGLASFPRQPGSLDDLMRPLLEQFVAAHPDLIARIRHVVHAHTLPSIRPFHQTGRALLDESGFADDTHYCSLTMGHCATSLSAVEYACSRLKEGEYALLLVGEKAFHPKVELIDDTTIMGEAACAVLLSRSGDSGKVNARYSEQAGEFSRQKGHESSSESTFATAYFAFISDAMRSALHHFDCSLDSLDWIAPHNVNLSSWQKLADELAIPRTKIFLENVPRYGHCFGADPYLNLAALIRGQQLSPGDNVMLVSVGMGATFSSLLLELPAGNEIPVFCNLKQYPDLRPN